MRLKHLDDFAARLHDFRGTLRGRHRANDHIVEIVRAAASTTDPERLAAIILARAGEWMGARGWAVVVVDHAGQLQVMARRGLDRAAHQVATGVADWVARHGTPFWAPDVSRDPRVRGRAHMSVAGFRLTARGRTMGALVGVDRVVPHARAAALVAGDLEAVDAVLEPAAAVLDSALAIRHLEALSVSDDLTGLFNARYLNQALGREAKRATRSGRPLSVLFVDLDGFKGINDQYGHQAGSRALVEAGRVMAGCARESDTVSRYGGDEFALVLPETPGPGAVVVAERVRERLAAHGFLESEGINFRLTASVGVATLPGAAVTGDELLKAADRAMYLVKARGKNGIAVAPDQGPGAGG